jgi:hypothetical protein
MKISGYTDLFTPSKEEDPKLYYSMQHMLGFAHLYSGEYLKSSQFFNKILEQAPNTTPSYLYFDACLNLSTVLSSDPIANVDEIRRLNQIVINSESLIRDSIENEPRTNHLLTIAYYNLAKISKEIGDIESAYSSIKSSIQLADERTQIFLNIEACDISARIEEKKGILELCVQDIVDKKISVGTKNKEYPLDFTLDVCAKLIERLSENSIDQGLDKLILHLANNDILHDVSVGDVLTQAAYMLLSKSNSKSAIKLITKAIDFPNEEMNFELRRYLLTIGILSTPFSNVEQLVSRYWHDYIDPLDAHSVETDYRLVWGLAQRYFSSGELDRAKVVIAQIRDLIEKTWGQIPDEADFEQMIAGRVLLDALDLELGFRQGAGEALIQRAEEFLIRLNEMQAFPLPHFPDDFLSQLRSRFRSFITPSIKSISTNRRVMKKYGRNEKIRVRFEDGRIEEGKYKHFETKLNNGHCKIIDS